MKESFSTDLVKLTDGLKYFSIFQEHVSRRVRTEVNVLKENVNVQVLLKELVVRKVTHFFSCCCGCSVRWLGEEVLKRAA